ncbi:hypothetical protein SDC9_72866 [bioreactor metagenome]|uniref:Uncharacterized protein n=1 Tax=bioreactor metagenome TaxID=1076179 RepID=A0A644YCT8_9ZZZZ
MLDGVVPLGIVVGVGAQVQTDTLAVQRGARQGHIVFPANQSAHVAPWRFHNGKIILIGVPPDNALGACRLQLPVVAKQLSVWSKDHIRAVQGAVFKPPLCVTD